MRDTWRKEGELMSHDDFEEGYFHPIEFQVITPMILESWKMDIPHVLSPDFSKQMTHITNVSK